jgi:hypothetical protein
METNNLDTYSASQMQVIVRSVMGEPRDVARSGWAGRERDDAHAHNTIAKHTYKDPLQVTQVCVCVYVTSD